MKIRETEFTEEGQGNEMCHDNEFNPIKNPYGRYSHGPPVDDPSMFFGREELIARIADSVKGSGGQNTCNLIYGQYRSGKSSILYHLKRLLQEDRKLLVLDLGNFRIHLDSSSSIPIQNQFLMSILRKLEDAIYQRVETTDITSTGSCNS